MHSLCLEVAAVAVVAAADVAAADVAVAAVLVAVSDPAATRISFCWRCAV